MHIWYSTVYIKNTLVLHQYEFYPKMAVAVIWKGPFLQKLSVTPIHRVSVSLTLILNVRGPSNKKVVYMVKTSKVIISFVLTVCINTQWNMFKLNDFFLKTKTNSKTNQSF